MIQEYKLTKVAEWATFEVEGLFKDRAFQISTRLWKALGRPTELLITVEGLEPYDKG